MDAMKGMMVEKMRKRREKKRRGIEKGFVEDGEQLQILVMKDVHVLDHVWYADVNR